ncbi:hypothetical protein [Myroides injenensis]|uniref:hypothetical protein n=1 Tax=Myroides injenensis TaxID=1183151 RepID=UPI000288526B|nr:hypothetical protein [Myroides injenensis]
MKRVLLLGALLFCMGINAQNHKNSPENDYDRSATELLSKSDYYGLTFEQRKKIINRKKTIGREFAAIGRDRSLSGWEKGEKKRELAQSFRNDIYAILDSNQKKKWDSYAEYKFEVNNKKNDIEYKLDVLELEYEKDIKTIERQYRNDEYTMKLKKKERKAEYKAKKEELKKQKDQL